MTTENKKMNALNVDLTDPNVRRLITGDESRIIDPSKPRREMVQLAGDVSDPTGRTPGQRGLMSTHRLDTEKIEVLVAYRGRIGDFDMTVDVYALAGEHIELHLICPKCHHKSRITGERKKIEFDQHNTRPYSFVNGVRRPTNGGRLDVEPFECGWEMPDAGEHKTGIRAGGITLCRMRMAIDGSVAKDA
jgi:hypothetical protein